MEKEADFLNTSINKWKVLQVIVFDWQDGPREGICLLEEPRGCFFFEVIATSDSLDDLDDCLFSISEINSDYFLDILKVLSNLGKPVGLVWIPKWRFSNNQMKKSIEEQLEKILSYRQKTTLIIQTKDMINFLHSWREI